MWCSCPNAACSTEDGAIARPGRALPPRRPSRWIAPALAGLAVLGVYAADAAPDGWSLSGTLSERLSAISNPGLSSTGGKAALQSTTRLSLSALKADRAGSLALDAAISPVLSTQSTPDNPIGLLAPNVSARLTLNGKRSTFSGYLRGSLTSTAFLDQLFGLDAQGNPDPTNSTLVTGTAIQAVYAGGLGLNWTPTRADSFGLNLDASRVDFFDGGTSLVPNTNIALSGNWSRVLTRRWTGTLDGRLGYFTADSAENVQSVFATANAGFTYTPLRRLSFSGSLGAAFSRTERNDLTLPGNPRVTDTVFSATGVLSFSYTPPIRDLAVTFSLTQNVQPSSLGALQNTTALNASATYTINRAASLGLNARAQLQSDLGSGFGFDNATVSLRLGPSYSYQLTRDSALQLGYTLDYTDRPGTGDALSHTVFLSLSHNFNLLQ